MTMGNSEEFGEFVSASEAKLGRDMAARAEAAIADDRIAADLRFGHDSGLWPLAGFLGLEGPEEIEHEEISESDPAVSERSSDASAVPETCSALSDDTDPFSDDSDMMFTQVKEAWSRLTPSGRRVVWSLVRELSVLKELQR